MRITTLQDITPIINALNRLGLNSALTLRNGLFSHPERYIIGIIGIVMWGIALFNYTLENLNDFDKVIAATAINVQLYVTVSKNVIFLARRERFLRLNEALEQLAWEGNKTERKLWNTKNRPVLLIITAYTTSCQLCGIICVTWPTLKLLYYYLCYSEVVLTLPLPGIFPYDFTQPFFYILTTILFVLFTYFTVDTLAIVEGLYGWFVFNISAHLQIMRLKLEHLLQLPLEGPDFQSDFADFITYHKQIISLAFELNNVYAPIIFLEFTFTSLPICFIAFKLSYLSDSSNVPYDCLLLSAIVIQIIIYCFGGEKVQNECDELCESIYLLIPWHILPQRHCRLYLMPLMRSQRVLTLTGYFFTANRSLLVWIFRTAGSFAAVLIALKEKEK